MHGMGCRERSTSERKYNMKTYGVIMAGGGGTPFLAAEYKGRAETVFKPVRQRYSG